jgi:hypothetical protein
MSSTMCHAGNWIPGAGEDREKLGERWMMGGGKSGLSWVLVPKDRNAQHAETQPKLPSAPRAPEPRCKGQHWGVKTLSSPICVSEW